MLFRRGSHCPTGLFIPVDTSVVRWTRSVDPVSRLAAINRARPARAYGMLGVATSSARRRRENRLLSRGTLIITHANESYEKTRDERRPACANHRALFTRLAPEVPSPIVDAPSPRTLLQNSSCSENILQCINILSGARLPLWRSLCSRVVSHFSEEDLSCQVAVQTPAMFRTIVRQRSALFCESSVEWE